MKYKLRYSKKAKKTLDSYGKDVRERLEEEFIGLLLFLEGKESMNPDVKFLKGKYQGLYCLRIGKYRAIFCIEPYEQAILIIDINSRGDIY